MRDSLNNGRGCVCLLQQWKELQVNANLDKSTVMIMSRESFTNIKSIAGRKAKRTDCNVLFVEMFDKPRKCNTAYLFIIMRLISVVCILAIAVQCSEGG